MDTGTTIKRLVGPDNFRTWEIQVKKHLQSKGLWGFTTGTALSPTVKGESETLLDFATRIERHEQRCFTAKAAIINSCSDGIMISLESCNTAKDAWDQLGKSLAPLGNTHQVFMDWINMTFDGRDLGKFCSDFQNGMETSAQLGMDIGSSMSIHIFIGRISDHFESHGANLREQMRRSTTTNTMGQIVLPFTLQEVISGVLQAQRGLETRNQANFTKGKPQSKGSQHGKGKPKDKKPTNNTSPKTPRTSNAATVT